jgi:hypothetical protein
MVLLVLKDKTGSLEINTLINFFSICLYLIDTASYIYNIILALKIFIKSSEGERSGDFYNNLGFLLYL